MDKKVITIFFIAILVRVIFLTLSPARPMDIDDTISWDAVAWNFLSGRGFLELDGSPTCVRPPVYPIFLASIYFLVGRDFFVVKLVQSLLNALTCVIIFFIARKLVDIKIAFYSGIICALWPGLIVYNGIIGSEILFTFLLYLFLLLLFPVVEKNSYWNIVLSGLVLGIANLTRSTLVGYLVMLAIFIVVLKKMKNLVSIGIIFIISMLVVLPWTWRNYKVFNRFLLINTSAGELFWSGTYLPWDGICKHNRDENFFKLFNLENPVDNERKMFREGIRNIIENPGGFIYLSIKKFFRFWFKPVGGELVSRQNKILGLMMYIFQFIFVLLFFYGLIANISKVPLYIVVLFIYFCIMHNLLAPIPRYRLPLEPLMIIFSIKSLRQILSQKLKIMF